jgi:hypothetical protein
MEDGSIAESFGTYLPCGEMGLGERREVLKVEVKCQNEGFSTSAPWTIRAGERLDDW